MPDEVKPDATRPAFRLRAALVVPAGWPPDVAPNQIITASHINAIKASVYAWPGNVDGQLHTLSNVHLVGATGVLSDPTLAAGDLIARDAAAIGRLPVGGAGQVLTVDTALPMKLKWATPALAPVLSFNTRTGAVMPQAGDYTAAMVAAIPATLLTTKGDLIGFSTATGRMPAGIDGQVLRADAAATFGLRWAGESVPSVFTRTGPIVAQAGDYTASQVTNAVSVLGSYPDPVWLTSLSYGKLIGVPTSFTPAAHTHDAAAIVSGVLATARLGTGVANNTVYLRGDGTWAAAGTGGGGGVISVFGRAGQVDAQAGDYTAAMVGAIPANLLTSTGDLLVRNNINQLTRLPIGASGQVLQADLATSVGMKWTSISASVQTPWVTNIDAANFDLVNVHRLGVALAVPNYAVDVVGDVNYTGVLRSNGVPVVFGGSQTPWTQNINASGFSLNNAGTIGVGVTAPQAAPIQVATHTPGIAGSVAVQDLDATTSGNPVLLVTGLGSEGTRAWAVGNRGGATYLKDLYIWNDRSSDMLFGTNSAERMRITAAGLVGIGRTPATYQLEVQGDVSVTGTYRINGVPIATSQTPWTQDIDGAGFRLLNTGNVGIGTAGPAAPLDVVASNAAVDDLLHLTCTPTSGPYMRFKQGGLDRWTIGHCLAQAAVGSFVFYSTAPVMTILAGGNVGIGTPNPSHKLDVSGSFAAATADIASTTPSIRIWETTGNQTFTQSLDSGGMVSWKKWDGSTQLILTMSNGNFGIGPHTPLSMLAVINPTNPGTLATSNQIAIGENTNNPTYRMSIGFGAVPSWSGVIQATAGTPAAGLLLLQPAGGNVAIRRSDASYPLDVSGDVNASQYRINGVGACTLSGRYDLTGGRTLNTGVYQNANSRPIFVTIYAIINVGSYLKLLTDAGNPPTNPVAAWTNVATGGGITAGGSVSGFVMPGHFYKVETPGASLQSWYEYL